MSAEKSKEWAKELSRVDGGEMVGEMEDKVMMNVDGVELV